MAPESLPHPDDTHPNGPSAPTQEADQAEREAGTDTGTKPAPGRPYTDKLPAWKVILHNDDFNEFGYVAETVEVLTPLKRRQAIERTLEAHTRGQSLLLTTHRERAELYKQQFASRHLTVTIEES